jgi:hypothetical protein
MEFEQRTSSFSSFIIHHSSLILLGAIIAACGCGSGTRTVPVSGQVKLDKQPLAGAHVTFRPDSKEINPGPASYGTTDAEGRFVLRTMDGHDGAVVGPHKVRISLPVKTPGTDPDAPAANKVPAKYSGGNTVLTFTVPEGGTTEANFLDLTSR